MPNREKVTYGLRCMCYGDVECKECPYARNGSGWHDCRSNCAKDALALLKEQEAYIEHLEEMNEKYGYINIVRCKDCKHKEESVSPSWEAWCNRLHCGCDFDWFCADGEREMTL